MDKNKVFKNEQGTWFTNALFWELLMPEDRGNVMYTLKDYDIEHEGKTLPSLKRLYLETGDPTEYEFAAKYLGGWQHWKKVSTSAKIAPHVEEWREELEVRLRSKGIKAMISKAEDGDYQPSKYLADKGWELKKRGAPSKAEKARELKVASKVASVIDMDYKRLMKD